MITHDRLLQILKYNPKTGHWIRRLSPYKSRIGKRAGTIRKARGRCPPVWVIYADQKLYSSARLAWLYVTGQWPAAEIDHKNTNSLDDRWDNLRPATRAQNNANKRCYKSNKFGLKGVHHPKNRRYRAQIQKNGERISLGSFDTEAAAYAAYCSAAHRLFGEFARTA